MYCTPSTWQWACIHTASMEGKLTAVRGEVRTAGSLRPGAAATGAAGGRPMRHMYVMMYRIHRTTLRRQYRWSHAKVLHVLRSLSLQGQKPLTVP